jgi:hypothetical protein
LPSRSCTARSNRRRAGEGARFAQHGNLLRSLAYVQQQCTARWPKIKWVSVRLRAKFNANPTSIEQGAERYNLTKVLFKCCLNFRGSDVRRTAAAIGHAIYLTCHGLQVNVWRGVMFLKYTFIMPAAVMAQMR